MIGTNPCTIGIFWMFDLKEAGLCIVLIKNFSVFFKMKMMLLIMNGLKKILVNCKSIILK